MAKQHLSIPHLIALLGIATPPAHWAHAEPSKETPGVTLTVKIKGLKNSEGKVLVSLFRGPTGYPTRPEKRFQGQVAAIQSRNAQVAFNGLPPGDYGVAVIHDANGNNRVDTNWIGIPVEGMGASNNARGKFGPPSFKDARIRVQRENRTIQVTMAY